MLDLIQYGSDNVRLGEMNSVAVQFKFLSVFFFFFKYKCYICELKQYL